ncbi:MAG: peptidylprolyl isomerase [Gemmataceae bacterium]
MFRTSTWTRRAVAAGVLTAGFGLAAGTAQQPPAAKPAAADAPIAYIYDNIPVTRADLGEFLMARGGYEKLELLVNKKIIERECAKRNITVTETELVAALEEDLKGLQVSKADFVKVVLGKYQKTLYEWMEDVIRPKLLLDKLCKDRVKVTEADLRVQFEREFGEKRRVQLVIWPLGDDQKAILKEWEKMRSSQAEFDRAARTQANPSLAAAQGYVKPICRHLPAPEKDVEEWAFKLTPGEISPVLKTSQGYLCLKMHEVLPADTKVTFEAVKAKFEKQAYEDKLTEERPKFFAELKKAANPRLLYGGPTEWRYDPNSTATAPPADKLQGVQPAGGTQPAEKK